MAKLEWDKTGSRLYETGVSQVALYVLNGAAYNSGVAWSGVTAINKSPSGAEPSPIYADNIKYLSLMSAEEFGGSIEAYMYPDEWKECDGSKELVKGVVVGQQPRKTFGLAFKTILGNDTENEAHGYKLHLIYGALASPSESAYTTVNDSPEAITFSWEFTTTPVATTGMKPVSCITIDSTKADAGKLAAFEKILYGGDSGNGPRLPLPDEVKTLMTTGGIGG